MDKTWNITLKAALSLMEMKNSKLDEATAKELRKLMYEEDILDAVMEENKVEVDQEASEDTNENENITGFDVNPKFIKKLKSNYKLVESLTIPPLGHAIDGIALPTLPPIKTLQEKIGICSTPFEKQLTTTDMDMGQGKLTFCKMAVERLFRPMLKTNENIKLGIDVTVYDEKGRAFPMSFKYWSNKIYVLTSGWKLFSMKNEFRMLEDWVTVWMFRRNNVDKLCFAIIPRRFPTTKRICKARKKGCKSVVKEEKGEQHNEDV